MVAPSIRRPSDRKRRRARLAHHPGRKYFCQVDSGASTVPLGERARRLAWIALRFSGEPEARFGEFTRQTLGRELDLEEAHEAIRTVRPRSRRTGRKPKANPVRRREPKAVDRVPALVDWLLVDESKLDLIPLMFDLPNAAPWRPRPDLVDQVAGIVGITQVLEVGDDRDVHAFGVARSEQEADQLLARLQDLVLGRGSGEGVRMRKTRRRVDLPARTWVELARRELAGGD